MENLRCGVFLDIIQRKHYYKYLNYLSLVKIKLVCISLKKSKYIKYHAYHIKYNVHLFVKIKVHILPFPKTLIPLLYYDVHRPHCSPITITNSLSEPDQLHVQ